MIPEKTTDQIEPDVVMRFGMHKAYLNALDEGNHRCATRYASTPAQRGLALAVGGDLPSAVDVFRRGSRDKSLSAEQRGLAGLFLWASETNRNRERSDREHKKAISEFFVDNASFSIELHALEQRTGDLSKGSRLRDGNKLCQHMLNFQRQSGDFVEGFRDLSRASASIYVAGVASLMLAAYWFLRLPENSESVRLREARLGAFTKLFSDLEQKAKEFDTTVEGVPLSPDMIDWDGTQLLEGTAAEEEAVETPAGKLFTTINGVPLEHLSSKDRLAVFQELRDQIRSENNVTPVELDETDRVMEEALLTGKEDLAFEKYEKFRNLSARKLKRRPKNPNLTAAECIDQVITPLANQLFSEAVEGKTLDADLLTINFQRRATESVCEDVFTKVEERKKIKRLVNTWIVNAELGAARYEGKKIASVGFNSRDGVVFNLDDTTEKPRTKYFPKITFEPQT